MENVAMNINNNINKQTKINHNPSTTAPTINPNNNTKKLKWEQDFSHNWNILKNPSLLTQMDKLTLNSTEDCSIQTNEESKVDSEPINSLISPKTNFNFNFMRNLIIVLDLSQNSIKVDFKPNRHKFIIKKVESFIIQYFKYNIASSIIIVTTKDYISQIISPFSNNIKEIISNLIKGTQVPSGNFSLTNSMRVCLECIISNKTMNNDIMLISSSPISFDRDNIFEIITLFTSLKVEVNVLSLETPYELLKSLSKLTNGTFAQATQEKEVDNFLSDIIYKRTNKQIIKLSLAGNQVGDNNLICFCHHKLISLGYSCKVCNNYYCTLPSYCRHCETLNVNMTMVYQIKKGNSNSDNQGYLSKPVCKPYKLYKYYSEHLMNDDFIKFVDRINSTLFQMHNKEFTKEAKCPNDPEKKEIGFKFCGLEYQIKILFVYLKYKSSYLFHNMNKNIKSNTEENLISETKLFLLKDSLRCSGCEENIEINDAQGLRRVFVYDKCLDTYCETCYRFIIENDIGCVSCCE